MVVGGAHAVGSRRRHLKATWEGLLRELAHGEVARRTNSSRPLTYDARIPA